MKCLVPIALTKTQNIILKGAAERNDGTCRLPDRIKRSAAQKSVTGLIEKGLVREVKALAPWFPLPGLQRNSA